jgi:hypothetical protein
MTINRNAKAFPDPAAQLAPFAVSGQSLPAVASGDTDWTWRGE